ncbi:MAG: energy-coupling factor transporter transmembrane component T [Peptococcia bacterium]|jgi:energy-coupling factor transport system permease protein
MDVYNKKEEQEKMRQRLHPVTVLLYLGAVVFLSLFYAHPFFLLSLFIAVGIVILSYGLGREWLGYLKVGFGFLLVIMIVNVLFVRAGSTVLLLGPTLPGLGRIRITGEALCYGMGMGLRLLVIISVFCLLMYVLHPDHLLRLLGGMSYKTALTLGLSLRLFPLMRADFLRITEVQQCRGVNFRAKKKKDKVRQIIPVLRVLLLSSLERAFQLAESLQARGYGLGRRSHYLCQKWRLRDKFIIICICGGTLLSLWLVGSGRAAYSYYPRLQSVKIEEVYGAVLIGLLFIVPACFNWGWKKWPSLRSRI